MNIQTLNIPGFSIMDFFLKFEEPGLSFLHTGEPTTKEDWSILAWNPGPEVTSWEELSRRHLARKKSSALGLPFCGGGIGTFRFENPTPHFRFYDSFLCYKHSTQEIFTSDPDLVHAVWTKSLPNFAPPAPLTLTPTWPKAEYEKAFAKIKEYILSGDIYQINLTQELAGTFAGDPKQLFRKICETNPAPHSAFLDYGEMQILSASPERFITFKNGKITTAPVKGTRPRGHTAEEDEHLKEELLTSEKESAELNMITDLLRNDIGQVSQSGTVKVLERHGLQVCPTVFHTYSLVEGQARPELSSVDMLKACLPGGSVSGCPKQRACEIIAELEPKPRGLYTGTLALISDDGSMDSSILIRTLLHQGGKLSLGVGGGIVADSECESEYQETLQKASSFLNL